MGNILKLATLAAAASLAVMQPALAADAKPGAAPAQTTQATANLSAADKAFLTQAGGGGLYEVEVSRLAAGKTKNPELKAFAEMLVADHTAANGELKSLAEGKGFALPTEMPAGKKAVIDRLSRSADFDRDFLRQVGLADHKANIALFEKESKGGRDADLKAWAGKTVPKLKEHLAHAEQLSRGKQVARGAMENNMAHPELIAK